MGRGLDMKWSEEQPSCVLALLRLWPHYCCHLPLALDPSFFRCLVWIEVQLFFRSLSNLQDQIVTVKAFSLMG